MTAQGQLQSTIGAKQARLFGADYHYQPYARYYRSPAVAGLIAFPAALLLHIVAIMAAWQYAQLNLKTTMATMSVLYASITIGLIGLMRKPANSLESQVHRIAAPGTLLP